MGGLGSGDFDGDLNTNLLRKFIDESDLLLGQVLETQKGREIYDEVENDFEVDSALLVYGTAYKALVSYADKTRFSLTDDDARIVAWAMVQKALTDVIHEELSE